MRIIQIQDNSKPAAAKALSLFMAAVLAFGLLPATGLATVEQLPEKEAMEVADLPKQPAATPAELAPQAETFVTVSFTAQNANQFLFPPQFNTQVSSLKAESYGFKDFVDGVSALDVMVAAHEKCYKDFSADTAKSYIKQNDNGFVTKSFNFGSNQGFSVNHTFPGGKNGTTADKTKVNNGDTVEFFAYQDDWVTDQYVWFHYNGLYVNDIMSSGQEQLDLVIKGYSFAYLGDMLTSDDECPPMVAEGIEYATAAWVNANTGEISPISNSVSDEDGAFSITTPAENGTYYLTTYMTEEDILDGCRPLLMSLLKITVDKNYVAPKDRCQLSSLGAGDFESFPQMLSMSPAFSPDVLNYQTPVIKQPKFDYQKMLYVKATSLNSKATFTASLNGGKSYSVASAGPTIPASDGLKPGMNTLAVTVTVPRGASTESRTYTVRIYMEGAPVEEKLPEGDNLQKVQDGVVNSIGNTVAAPQYGSVGGEWSVIAAAQSGRPFSDSAMKAYVNSIVRVIEEGNGKLPANAMTDYSRTVIALTAGGYDVSNFAGCNLLEPLGDVAAVCKQGVNGPIWALIALDSRAYDVPLKATSAVGAQAASTLSTMAASAQATTTLSIQAESTTKVTAIRQALIDEILKRQLPDGGWDLGNTTLNADVTGMALTALAPYKKLLPAVSASIDKAMAGLSGSITNPYGALHIEKLSPESCVQVILGLTALGINPATDARFVSYGNSCVGQLLKHQTADGSFAKTPGGSKDLMSTEQAAIALLAYKNFLNGKAPVFSMANVPITKIVEAPQKFVEEAVAGGKDTGASGPAGIIQSQALGAGRGSSAGAWATQPGGTTLSLDNAPANAPAQAAPDAALAAEASLDTNTPTSTDTRSDVSKDSPASDQSQPFNGLLFGAGVLLIVAGVFAGLFLLRRFPSRSIRS